MKQLLRKTPIINIAYFYLAKRIKLYKNVQRLKQALKTSDTLRIVIGSASICEEKWIPTDIEYLNILKPTDWEIFFHEKSIDTILSEHVWEHLTPQEGLVAAKNCYKYLKEGAYIRIAVPDGLHPDKNYINEVRVGGIGSGADDHKILYTYKSLSTLFEQAGFQIELLEYFDEEQHFHANEWDTSDGMVHRSKQFDQRNLDGQLHYTSIILDARKVEQ